MNINYPFQAIDLIAKAGLGYAVGILTATNANLWAVIGVVESVAEPILAKLSSLIFDRAFSARTIKDVTRFISQGGAIAALHHFSLISLKMAGLLGFVASLYLLAQRNWTNETGSRRAPPVPEGSSVG